MMFDSINQISQQWVEFFGIALLQNTVFLIFLFLVLAALRRIPARWKYTIATVGLLKCLVPPFLKIPVISSQSMPLVHALFTSVSIGSVPGSVESVPAAGLSVQPWSIVFMAWSACVLIVLSVIAASTLRMRLLLKKAEPLQDKTIDGLLQKNGIRVFLSDRIRMPLTIGIFSRRVYVPSQWKTWSPKCKEMALQHEIAHIRRFDGLVRVLQSVVQSLYFFHPLVWYLNRRLNVYREMACDDLSFQVGKQSALEYSRFLLQVAERMVCDTIRYESVSTLIRKRNELLSRVKYQIMEDDMVPVKKHKLALIGFLMGFCFIALSWTGVQKEQDSKTELSKGKTIQTDISKGKQSSTTPVLIEIRTEGQKTTYYIEGEAVVLEKLGDTLVKLKKNDPATVLEIRVSKDTEMWSIYDLNGVLTDINIRRVGYISDDSKKTVVNAPGTGARVKKVSESDDDLRIMLPREEDKDIIATIPKKNVTAFLIRASGKLEHEGLDMDYSMIPDKVKSMLKENPHLIVSILCEKNSKSSDFIRVLGLVKQAGAPRIFIDNTPVNP